VRPQAAALAPSATAPPPVSTGRTANVARTFPWQPCGLEAGTMSRSAASRCLGPRRRAGASSRSGWCRRPRCGHSGRLPGPGRREWRLHGRHHSPRVARVLRACYTCRRSPDGSPRV